MTNNEKRNIYNAIQNLYNMDFTTWQEVLAMLYNLVADVEQKFEKLETKFNVDIVKVDERNSTVEASMMLHNNNKKAKKQKSCIDSAAAMIILERYLKQIGQY